MSNEISDEAWYMAALKRLERGQILKMGNRAFVIFHCEDNDPEEISPEPSLEEALAAQVEIDSANEVTDDMARAALQEWLGISYDKNPDEYAHDLCEAKQAIKAALEVRSK